jgi:hypothetical protein
MDQQLDRKENIKGVWWIVVWNSWELRVLANDLHNMKWPKLKGSLQVFKNQRGKVFHCSYQDPKSNTLHSLTILHFSKFNFPDMAVSFVIDKDQLEY